MSSEQPDDSGRPITSLNAHLIQAAQKSSEAMSPPITHLSKPGLAIYKTLYDSPYYLPTDSVPVGSQLFTLPPPIHSTEKHQIGVLVVPDFCDPRLLAAKLEKAAIESPVVHFTPREPVSVLGDPLKPVDEALITAVQPIVGLDVPTTVHFSRFPAPVPLHHNTNPQLALIAAAVAGVGYYNVRKTVTQVLQASVNKPNDLLNVTLRSITPPMQRTISRLALAMPLFELSLATFTVNSLFNFYHNRKLLYFNYKASSDIQNKLKLQPSLVTPLIITHAHNDYQFHPSAYEHLQLLDKLSSRFNYDRTEYIQGNDGDEQHSCVCEIAVDVPVPAQQPNALFDIIDNTQQRVIQAISGQSLTMSEYAHKHMPSKENMMTKYYASMVIGGASLLALSYGIARFTTYTGNFILKQIYNRATKGLRLADFKTHQQNASEFLPREFNTMALEHHRMSVIKPTWDRTFLFSFVRSCTAVFSMFYYHKLVDQGRLNASRVIENVPNLTVPFGFSSFIETAEVTESIANANRPGLRDFFQEFVHRRSSIFAPQVLESKHEYDEENLDISDLDIPLHLSNVFGKDAIEARKKRRELAFKARQEPSNDVEPPSIEEPSTLETPPDDKESDGISSDTTTDEKTTEQPPAAPADGTETPDVSSQQPPLESSGKSADSSAPITEITITAKKISDVVSTSDSKDEEKPVSELSPTEIIDKAASQPLRPTELWFINNKAPEYMPGWISSPFTMLSKTLVTTPTSTLINTQTSSNDKTPREFHGYFPDLQQKIEQGTATSQDLMSSPYPMDLPNPKTALETFKQHIDYIYKYDTRSLSYEFAYRLLLGTGNSESPPSSFPSQLTDTTTGLIRTLFLATAISLPVVKSSMTYYQTQHLAKVAHNPSPSAPYGSSLFNLIQPKTDVQTFQQLSNKLDAEAGITRMQQLRGFPAYVLNLMKRALPSSVRSKLDAELSPGASPHAQSSRHVHQLFLDKSSHLRQSALNRLLFFNSFWSTITTYRHQSLVHRIVPASIGLAAIYLIIGQSAGNIARFASVSTSYQNNGFTNLNALFPIGTRQEMQQLIPQQGTIDIQTEIGALGVGFFGKQPVRADLLTLLGVHLYNDVNRVYTMLSSQKVINDLDNRDAFGFSTLHNRLSSDLSEDTDNADDVDEKNTTNDDAKKEKSSLLPSSIKKRLDNLIENVPTLVLVDDDDDLDNDDDDDDDENSSDKSEQDQITPTKKSIIEPVTKSKQQQNVLGTEIQYVGVPYF